MTKARHKKWAGCIEYTEHDEFFWARIVEIAPGHQPMLMAQFPLTALEGRPYKVGRLFTIHRTKAGRLYFYWDVGKPITKRQIKQAKQWARKAMRMFND